MTSDTKWIVFAGGLVVCFYAGWLFPPVLLGFLGLVLVLLVSPTKPKRVNSRQQVSQQTSQTRQAYIATPSHALDVRLQELANRARNNDVREGILQSLRVVQQTRAAATGYVQEPVQPVRQQPTYPAIHRVPQSMQDVAEAKKRQELKNINTILYVACFLLVGAAALFVGFSPNVPELVKFGATALVTAAFYVTGIILHHRSARLRPAATAFVGTGLALLPFAGLALHSYVLNDGPMAWLLTSLVGFIAFMYATLKIRSAVLSYLTIALIFSIATSGISVLHSPLVWFFVAVIATSTVLLIIGYRKPRRMPVELAVPIQNNGHIAALVAVLGSLFLFKELDVLDYVFVFGIAALHYFVTAYILPVRKDRYIAGAIGRGLLIPFVLTATYYFTHSSSAVWNALLISALLLNGYSSFVISKERWELGWFWVVQSLVVISLIGFGDSVNSVSAILLLLLGLSIQHVYQNKRAEFGIAGIIAAGILPMTLLLENFADTIELRHVAIVVLGLAAMSFVAKQLTRSRPYLQWLLLGALLSFSTEALILAIIDADMLWYGAISAAVAAMLYVLSYADRNIGYMIGSSVIAVNAGYFLFGAVLGDYTWALFATAVILGSLWYTLRWYAAYEDHSPYRQARIDTLTLSSVGVVLFGATAAILFKDETIVAGALMGCVSAGIIAYEGYVRDRKILYEVALYVATISLQRLVAFVYPDASFLVYSHWWAFTLGLGALLALVRLDAQMAKLRGILALSALSLPTALFALDFPEKYQVLFLLEHALLAVVGLVLNKKLALQWGAVGVALALLWLLRGYGYVLLVILGLSLIGFAIWRLMKRS